MKNSLKQESANSSKHSVHSDFKELQVRAHSFWSRVSYALLWKQICQGKLQNHIPWTRFIQLRCSRHKCYAPITSITKQIFKFDTRKGNYKESTHWNFGWNLTAITHDKLRTTCILTIRCWTLSQRKMYWIAVGKVNYILHIKQNSSVSHVFHIMTWAGANAQEWLHYAYVSELVKSSKRRQLAWFWRRFDCSMAHRVGWLHINNMTESFLWNNYLIVMIPW